MSPIFSKHEEGQPGESRQFVKECINGLCSGVLAMNSAFSVSAETSTTCLTPSDRQPWDRPKKIYGLTLPPLIEAKAVENGAMLHSRELLPSNTGTVFTQAR